MSTHDSPGGGHGPGPGDRTPYIVIGVLLVVAGLWLLGGTPLIGWPWPWFEPVRATMRVVRQVAWPLTVIFLGVLVIVYSRTSGARLPSREARLTRSRESSVVSGVIGGIAEYLGFDPAILRVGVVLAALVLGIVGQALIAYIVASIVIPRAPATAGVPGRPSSQSPPPPPPSAPGA